ncbi:MAG: hypothetical protein ABGZ35_06945 [Planctomycetaceae bacterium]
MVKSPGIACHNVWRDSIQGCCVEPATNDNPGTESDEWHRSMCAGRDQNKTDRREPRIFCTEPGEKLDFGLFQLTICYNILHG